MGNYAYTICSKVMKILGFPVFSSLFFRLILLDFLNKVEYHRTISGEKW